MWKGWRTRLVLRPRILNSEIQQCWMALRGRCLRHARAITKIQSERIESLAFQASVFPAVSILTDMPQANRRIGIDLEAALPGPLAKCIVLRQVPVSLFDRTDHRQKEGHCRVPKAFVAHPQLQLLKYRQIHFPLNEQKPRPRVQ